MMLAPIVTKADKVDPRLPTQVLPLNYPPFPPQAFAPAHQAQAGPMPSFAPMGMFAAPGYGSGYGHSGYGHSSYGMASPARGLRVDGFAKELTPVPGEGRARWATTTAPVNIAVIKYWGKRDVGLMLPLNSSLSGTLNQDDMASKTSVLASLDLAEDELWLNGVKEDIAGNKRVQTVIQLAREHASDVYDNAGRVVIKAADWPKYKLLIVSENNFPTAAGLASSASGYACLTYALAQVLNVETELSAIARRGSGSASRSMYGGWVKWVEGERADGTDSIAVQVAPHTHWPSMRVLVLVANDQKKHVSSSKGMQLTAATSPLIPDRLAMLPGRMAAMEKAILERDYATFADLTMKDSDNFHATCATTEPPIHYMTDVSRDVVKVVNAYNTAVGSLAAAYTFDAGPNAVIYLEDDHVLPFLSAVLHYFPAPDSMTNAEYLPHAEAFDFAAANPPPAELTAAVDDVTPAAGRLKYLLYTSVGDGPRVLDDSECLIDVEAGRPKFETE